MDPDERHQDGGELRSAARRDALSDPVDVPTTSHEGSLSAALAGLRDPVVLILFAAAFVDWISGNPVDGLLLGGIAVALAWENGVHQARGVQPSAAPTGSAGGLSATLRNRLLVAGGVLFAILFGALPHRSWLTTFAIVILGIAVLVRHWESTKAAQTAGPPASRTGTLAWVAVLVFGALWELSALLLQPNLIDTSFAHPTLSALADPALAGQFGRTVGLLVWLGIGWFLVSS